LLEYKK